MKINNWLLPVIMVALATVVFAENSQPSQAHSEESHHSNNHLAVFTGVTIHDGHSSFSIGADYEFLFHSRFGAVGLMEWVFADHLQTIAGAGLMVHPFAAAKFGIILGTEMADGHSVFLTRAIIGYDFHVGALSISPGFNLDLVNSHFVYVPGLGFGMGF